jgi:phospholipid transport system substrate-binding protein
MCRPCLAVTECFSLGSPPHPVCIGLVVGLDKGTGGQPEQCRMSVSRRIFLATGVAAALLPAIACAQSDASPASSASAAIQPIADFDAALLTVMKAGQTAPFPQRYQMLTPSVDRVFDLERILRVSVGSYWSALPPAQQAKLEEVFRSFIVATYVSSFRTYHGDTISVSPTTRAIGADQVVTSTFQRASADPLRIDYVMGISTGQNSGQGASAWRVQDILLDGTISRVAVQRSDFASLLSQGDASRLIASLTQKISVLSDGTIVS